MLSFLVLDTPGHPNMDQLRRMFRDYEKELDIDLCFQGFEEELATLPGRYGPPTGVLLLMIDEEQPVACGALRDLGEGICELKRIYVRPEHRGRGLGRAMSEELMRLGRELGYQRARLDTLERLTTARALYESLGFSEIEPYNEAAGYEVVYYELDLQR